MCRLADTEPYRVSVDARIDNECNACADDESTVNHYWRACASGPAFISIQPTLGGFSHPRSPLSFPMKIAVLAAAIVMTTPVVRACDQTIVLSNWKSCRAGPLSEKGGDADWPAVPAWTNDRAIRPYFYDDPRLLANHGLCNAKFRRVVLCLPGWEESQDKDACWYLICAGSRAARN
jgi:hypothetical protein